MSKVELRYYAAMCQTDLPNPTDWVGMHRNVGRMLELAHFAATAYAPFHDVRLIVFPEFSLAAPVYETVEELHEKLALPVPNEFTDRFHKAARQWGVFIQAGSFLERDERYPGHVFNTSCLIGPDGILLKYRKVHPWIPWELHSSPHDLPEYHDPLFPTVETEIGCLGAAICYDWLFPEAIRQLVMAGAEVLIRVSAYMDPWGTATPLDWWTVINRARAIENLAYVAACNQGSALRRYAPFSWPGGSMIVDYDGRILSQAEPGGGERIVVGPIDLAALRAERERRRGHLMPAHLRMEAYPAYSHSVYPAGSYTTPPQQQDVEAAILRGRQRWNQLRQKPSGEMPGPDASPK